MFRITRSFFILALVGIFFLVSTHVSTYAATERSLTILHTANTYNRIQEFKPFKQGPQGGAARQAAIIKQVRSAHPNTILLSAGNDVMGTPMFAQYGGVASGEVMSRLTYNAALANQMDLMADGESEGVKGYRSRWKSPPGPSNPAPAEQAARDGRRQSGRWSERSESTVINLDP